MVIKRSHNTLMEALGGRVYSSYSFVTSALDGVIGRHALAALYPWGKKPWYPLDGRLSEPQSWSGHRGYRKNPLPLQRNSFTIPYKSIFIDTGIYL
jgi:hypothetical protein